MPNDAQQLGEVLAEGSGILVTAESCTGGLIAELMTQIVGASAWFAGGWVTYSNEMKTSQLGVEANLIEANGAVSWQVAKAMSEGALDGSGANISISTTGIAGPSGGTDEKPVGTVFIGCSGASETQVREFRFQGTRDEIRKQSATAAIQMAYFFLTGETVEVMCSQHGKTIQ